jgi:hypothetical protein
MGFIKGKRSSGYFAIADLNGNIIHASEKVANCVRIAARKTTQIEMLNLDVLLQRRVDAEVQRQHKKQGFLRNPRSTSPALARNAARAPRIKMNNIPN